MLRCAEPDCNAPIRGLAANVYGVPRRSLKWRGTNTSHCATRSRLLYIVRTEADEISLTKHNHTLGRIAEAHNLLRCTTCALAFAIERLAADKLKGVER